MRNYIPHTKNSLANELNIDRMTFFQHCWTGKAPLPDVEGEGRADGFYSEKQLNRAKEYWRKYRQDQQDMREQFEKNRAEQKNVPDKRFLVARWKLGANLGVSTHTAERYVVLGCPDADVWIGPRPYYTPAQIQRAREWLEKKDK
jgi:hypothetical protein